MSTKHFFEYDLNGNLSKKSAKLSPKVIEYDFDLENRLKQVRIFDNGTTLSTRLSYRYDAFGRRIERKVEGAQTKITQFVHDGQDVLLEQNQTGQLERTYIRGPGIDELYGVIEDLNQSGTLSSSEAFFFRTDHLGSVREVVKADGTTRQSYVYSSYGVPTTTVAPGNSELKVNRLYTGRGYEPETGDYYYRARYYDAHSGRFLQEDPDPGTQDEPASFLTKYAYVVNDPVNGIDPNGFFRISINWKDLGRNLVNETKRTLTNPDFYAEAAIIGLSVTVGVMTANPVAGAAVYGGFSSMYASAKTGQGLTHMLVSGAVGAAFGAGTAYLGGFVGGKIAQGVFSATNSAIIAKTSAVVTGLIVGATVSSIVGQSGQIGLFGGGAGGSAYTPAAGGGAQQGSINWSGGRLTQ